MALQTKDYSITQKSSGGGITYTYILRVTENSTNTEKNTSNITVQAILKQSYSGTAFTTWYTGVSCTIDGSQIFSDYKQRSLSGTAETVYYTWTGDIAHNDDGSKSITVGGKIWQSSYASYSPPAMTISESSSNAMVLTTIPRASSISAGDADIGSTAIVVIGRNSTSFTHTIAYKFGSLSGYIGADGNPTSSAVKLSSASVGFNLPTSFYAQIPDKQYGTCTLICQTYSGSTAIGNAQTCSFKAKAVQDDCTPVVYGTAVDTNPKTRALTGGDGKTLVRYMSRVECTIDVTLRNRAGSVKQKKIGGVVVTGNTHTIEQPQSGTILFEATDSREYPGSYQVNLGFVPYDRLTNNASVKRTDPTSGKAELTLKGNCFKGNFGAAENTLTVKYQVNSDTEVVLNPEIRDDNTYEMVVDLSGLEYTKTHSITVTVEDALDSVPTTLPVNKGIPVFDWGENDFSFNVPVKLNEGIIGNNKAGLIAYPVGSIYMSVNATSPADIFGGTWERLQDRFLLGASSTHTAGETGGEETHVLKTNEMPSHNHSERSLVTGHSGWATTTIPQYSTHIPYDGGGYVGEATTVNAATVSSNTNTGGAGGGAAHNNMPPYLSVYMWKRTA